MDTSAIYYIIAVTLLFMAHLHYFCKRQVCGGVGFGDIGVVACCCKTHHRGTLVVCPDPATPPRGLIKLGLLVGLLKGTAPII